MKRKLYFPLLILLILPSVAHAQGGVLGNVLTNRNNGPSTMKHRPDVVPPKTVHGIVQDSQGTAIPGAKVLVRDIKANVTRTLITDKDGLYTIAGLPPAVDYEVSAQFSGTESDKKLVSSYLTREDNVVNLQLALIFKNTADGNGITLKTYDLVQLHARLDVPQGISGPFPAVLLLHGYGEDRTVWEPLKKRFLTEGWAVMTMDLRGHGESTTQNQQPFHASPAWRTDSQQFPLDLEPAVNWLKAQPRLDSRKLVIIGSDIGADLALLGSGRFLNVRTVVAIHPQLNEALAMAGSAQDFSAQSALLLVPDAADADGFKTYVKEPLSIRSFAISGGTANWLADAGVVDSIFSWIQKTY